MSKIMISVVIPTYNGSKYLNLCLKSLAEQTLDKELYEVLIVDNNSTDDTQDIIKSYIKKNTNFYYFVEKIMGGSHARNVGWAKSRGEYVAFIDDDAIADPSWLREMINFINNYPDAKAFGGPYIGYSEIPIPGWYPPEIGSNYLGNKVKTINLKGEWLTGTNMVFKKDIFNMFGGLNEELGPKGNTCIDGEDTEFLLRLKKNNIPIYYSPDIIVKHLIAKNRMNLKTLFTSAYNSGRNYNNLFDYEKSFFYYLYLFLKSILKSIFELIAFKKIPFKRKIYYSFRPLFTNFGLLIGFIKK